MRAVEEIDHDYLNGDKYKGINLRDVWIDESSELGSQKYEVSEGGAGLVLRFLAWAVRWNLVSTTKWREYKRD